MTKRFSIAILALTVALAPALRSQDTKENADFKLAVSLYNDKLYDLALEQLRQFVSTYPNTKQGIEARFYLGLTQLELKQYDEARLTFQNFALTFPDNPKAPEAWIKVAESEAAAGNAREAALAYERVKTFHPRSNLAPGALLKAAEYFEQDGDRESAKKVLRTLTQDYAASEFVFPARLTLASMYMDENQFELARLECKRVVDVSKEPGFVASGLLRMSVALRRLGRYDEAKTALNRIVSEYRTSESYYPALVDLGTVQEETGNTDEAVLTWKTVTGEKSSASPALKQKASIALGDLHMRLSDHTTALSEYERGAKIAGERTDEARYKAGVAAEKLGNREKASAYYLQAVKDTSRSLDRRAVLVGAFKGSLWTSDYRGAVQLGERFMQSFPEDQLVPRIALEVSRTFRQQLKNPRAAADLLDRAARRFPESSLIDDLVLDEALSLKQSGSMEEALTILEGFAERFPASGLIGQADEEAKAIRLFGLKRESAGVENLALLMGDVIGGGSKGELAFRLGEIYFNDLKDYERAAAQFESALGENISDNEKARAAYRRAQALEYLAWNERYQGKTPSQRLAQGAIEAYEVYMSQFPSHEFVSDAALGQLHLKLSNARTVADVQSIESEARTRLQNVKGKEHGYLAIGRAYQSLKDQDNAIRTFREILRTSQRSAVEAEVLYRLAGSLNARGQADSALAVATDFLKRFQSDRYAAQVTMLAATLESGKKNTDRAVQLYASLGEKYSYSISRGIVDRESGNVYFDAGKYAQAIPGFERYVRSLQADVYSLPEPESAVLLRLATCYDKTGNTTAAKDFYAAFLARDTSTTLRGSVYYALAAIARKEKNVELATSYLQEASRYPGSSPELVEQASLEAGELLFKSEAYSEAILQFSEVEQKTKSDSLKQYLQARIIVGYFRMDNLAEADKRATRFVKAHPRAASAAAEFEYERGRYHMRKQQFDLALKRFDNVIKQYARTPFVAEARYWTARTYEFDNKTDEAVTIYESILKDYPSHPIIPRTRLSLGNAYYALEKWDPAGRQYKALLDDPSTDPDLIPFAMNNLSLVYKEMGLYDAALELTRSYIQRFPDDPDLINKYIDIGVLYQRLGYYDQSVLHLQSLLENADADLEAELRYYIGEAYFYKGEYQQAVLEFLKVPYLVTKRTRADWVAPSYYMAGQSYEKMSRFDQAKTMYQQIIDRKETDPTFKTAAQKEIDRVNALVSTQRQ